MSAKTRNDLPFDLYGTEEWDSTPVKENEFGVTVRLDDEDSDNHVFVGIYHSTDVAETENGPTKVHRFNDMQGNKYTIWGSKDLDDKMAQVEEGEITRVEFLEKIELSKGRTLKRYKVQSKPLK